MDKNFQNSNITTTVREYKTQKKMNIDIELEQKRETINKIITNPSYLLKYSRSKNQVLLLFFFLLCLK